jgi:hypothetical protein
LPEPSRKGAGRERGKSSVADEVEIEAFELGESLVRGNQLISGSDREGGEVGVHPEFGGRGFPEGEGFPCFFETGWLGREGDPVVC